MENNSSISYTGRSRHINIRHLFVKNRVNKGERTIQYRPTKLVAYMIKPLQGKQFEILRYLIMKQKIINDIINDILRRTTRGFDVEEILISDKLYIIFWLRANTYKESGFTVPFNCTKCELVKRYLYEDHTLSLTLFQSVRECPKIRLTTNFHMSFQKNET